MRRHLRFIGTAALVLCLTGAVPSSYDAAAAAGACELVTRQEAATAFGAPVPAGADKAFDFPLKGEGGMIKMQSCFYGSAVIVARYELGSDAQVLFGRYRKELASQSGSTDYQNVDGIGDEAFAAKGQLMIRKGQTGLLISVSLGDKQNVRIATRALQAEKALASLALGRL